MNKKLVYLASTAGLAAILFVNSSAHAQAYTEQNNAGVNESSTGFYLGGFGGYGWTDAEINPGPDLDVNGGDWGVFAGYNIGGFLDRSLGIGMDAGLEAHYGWSSADDSAGVFGIEKDHEWGVSFRPGFSFLSDAFDSNLRPYAILGYRNASFDTAGAGTGDEDFDGFELGIGTELLAYGSYGIRLDYSHVFYGSEGGIDPDENDLRLGLAYHF